MNKLSIGILGCADIARRMVVPAIIQSEGFVLGGVASRNLNTAGEFGKLFGCEVYTDYSDLLASKKIDAVYIPLPPALHYEWAIKALESGKHVLIEKPATTALEDTMLIIEKSKEHNLAVFENYMFEYHLQINFIKSLLVDNEIGDMRLLRTSFGFPLRNDDDFRYNKILGGGALLDCGGYPIKLAQIFLGQDVEVVQSQLNYIDGFEVDMYGNGTIKNKENKVCQISFGFNSFYQCNCEIWGQNGKITANRIFTAPPGVGTTIIIEKHGTRIENTLAPDNHFFKTLDRFYDTISNDIDKIKIGNEILNQARLVETFK